MGESFGRDYISGGYYLALPADRAGYRSPDLLPESLLSGSACICDFFPDDWAIQWTSMEAEARLSKAARFRIDAAQLPAVLDWGTSSLSRLFGWPSAFYSLAAAQNARKRWLPADLDLVIFGLGINAADVEKFLDAARPPRTEEAGYAPVAESGVYECVSSGEQIAHGGEFAGFELLATYQGLLTCSWLCNGLENACRDELGIRPNEKGLLQTYADASICAQYISCEHVGAEPGLWLPWLVTTYPNR